MTPENYLDEALTEGYGIIFKKDYQYTYSLLTKAMEDYAIDRTKDMFTKQEVAALFLKFESDRNKYYPEDAATMVPLEEWLIHEGLLDQFPSEEFLKNKTL